jgi:hypothetical protein
MNPAAFAYSVVCDKTQPERSLVHGIAKRAGLSVNDIDCATIPVELPYVRLTKNIWDELSSLASAYRCHLECAPEKPLVFAHSPYQTKEERKGVPTVRTNEKREENVNEMFEIDGEGFSYTFTGEDIFYLRVQEKAELYRNTVRLKVNMPVALDKQEIWRYDDDPVLYDEQLQEYFPFRDFAKRKIEHSKYEAKYSIIDESGKERNVVFADEIDSQVEAESRLEFDSGDFSYLNFDTSTYTDKAIITLARNGEGNLKKAVIYGRPIVLDLNRSCFMRDDEEIASHGTAALNISGAYFSEQIIDGKPQYEDWVVRELAERLQPRKEFMVKTHRALFNARVGAKVQVKIKKKNEERKKEDDIYSGVITEFSFVYKKDSAFVSTFKILEL